VDRVRNRRGLAAVSARALTHAQHFALKVGSSTTCRKSMVKLRAAADDDLFRNMAIGISCTGFENGCRL